MPAPRHGGSDGVPGSLLTPQSVLSATGNSGRTPLGRSVSFGIIFQGDVGNDAEEGDYMKRALLAAVIAATGLLSDGRLWLRAQEPADPPRLAGQVPMPTLGGKQFWADELFFHQWRVQRSSLSGSCRLLDENDFCHATGSFEACVAALHDIQQQRRLPPMRGETVLVLHGLFRTRSSMNSICQYLRRYGGYEVLNVEYPSTQADVAAHARSLASIVDHLDGIDRIHLVGHSLGNIVIRRWLAQRAQQHQESPRLGRIVMLGPPNKGAQLATMVAEEPLFQFLAGAAGQQLGPKWPWLEASLATPPCEFGIIAGGLQNGRGFNPRLPGDNDGAVTVDSARLDGAKDFLVLPLAHSLLLEDKRVMHQTLQFLQEGHFQHPRD